MSPSKGRVGHPTGVRVSALFRKKDPWQGRGHFVAKEKTGEGAYINCKGEVIVFSTLVKDPSVLWQWGKGIKGNTEFSATHAPCNSRCRYREEVIVFGNESAKYFGNLSFGTLHLAEEVSVKSLNLSRQQMVNVKLLLNQTSDPSSSVV